MAWHTPHHTHTHTHTHMQVLHDFVEDAALRAAEATAKAEVMQSLSSGAREFVPASPPPIASYRATRGGGGGGGALVAALPPVHDAASPPPAAGGSLSVRHKAFLRRGRSKTAAKTLAIGPGVAHSRRVVGSDGTRRLAAAGLAEEQHAA